MFNLMTCHGLLRMCQSKYISLLVLQKLTAIMACLFETMNNAPVFNVMSPQ